MRFTFLYRTNTGRLLITAFLAAIGILVWTKVRPGGLIGLAAKSLSWLVPLLSLALTVYRFLEERRHSFHFDLTCHTQRAILRLSNYGADAVFVAKLVLRTEDANREFDLNRTADRGDLEIDITDAVRKTIDSILGDDLEVCLGFQTPRKRGRTEKKGFYVFAPHGVVEKITPGFQHPRDVECPECGSKAIFSVDGLEDEDQVKQRRRRVMRELKRSCPGHESRWIRAIADASNGQIRRFKNGIG